jgi:hypothetical protein
MIAKSIIVLVVNSIVIGLQIVTQAQTYNGNFPRLDSLLLLLNRSDSLTLDADISEFKKTYAFSWLCLVPSLGFNVLSNKPAMIFNATGFVSYFDNKRNVKRKTISIIKKAQLQHNQHKIKLITQYNALVNGSYKLNMIFRTYKEYYELFKLNGDQKKTNQIDPETAMRNFILQEERKKNIVAQIDNLNAIMVDLELLLNAKVFHQIPYESYLE